MWSSVDAFEAPSANSRLYSIRVNVVLPDPVPKRRFVERPLAELADHRMVEDGLPHSIGFLADFVRERHGSGIGDGSEKSYDGVV